MLFSAATTVSTVLEAAQQIVEAGKTPLGFNLLDISFVAAITLFEDIATEIIIHMRLQLLVTGGSIPTAWWEFTVSSCAGLAG